MTGLLLSCVGYFAVAFAVCYAGKALADRGHSRTGIAALEFGIALLRPADKIAGVTLFVFIFWAMEMAGQWEPPTPENIRKLDAQIEQRERLD